MIKVRRSVPASQSAAVCREACRLLSTPSTDPGIAALERPRRHSVIIIDRDETPPPASVSHYHHGRARDFDFLIRHYSRRRPRMTIDAPKYVIVTPEYTTMRFVNALQLKDLTSQVVVVPYDTHTARCR